MIATVEGDRILKVAADRDHPASRGYSCIKGRVIAAQHHASNRLGRPRLHGEEVSWDVLLDDLGARLQWIVGEGGPDRLGAYYGTGFVWDVGLMTLYRLLGGLGSKQIYSSQTLDGAPATRAAELVTGFPSNHPVWSPDDASTTLVVFLGTNPAVSGGYFGFVGSSWPHRLRGYRRRGGEVWVVDPRKTKTARLADRHLAPYAGTDVFLLAWLVRELLEEGYDAVELAAACDPDDVGRLRAAVAPFELEAVAQRTGLAPSDLRDLLAAVRRHGKVAIRPGTGVSFQPTGVLTYWLNWAVMILTGSLDREGGLHFLAPGRAALDGPPVKGHASEDGEFPPGPNSRPDLSGRHGELPSAALVDEIEAGEVKALLILGGSPLTSAPAPDRLRAALAKLEVLAVFDTFDNELTEMATHVIPTTWMTERGAFIHAPIFGMSRVYSSPALVPPGAERRQAWWVLAHLGRKLGVEVLDGADPDTVDDETVIRQISRAHCDYADDVFEAGPDGVAAPYRYGWFREKMLPGGRWRLAPRVLVDRLAGVWSEESHGLRLVSGRIMSSVNAAHYASDEPPPIHLSADAAAEQRIETGDRIRISSAFGAVEGRAEVDETLADQSVWLTHGWRDQNVNALNDPMPDRLTGQPYFSGVPVRVERLDPLNRPETAVSAL